MHAWLDGRNQADDLIRINVSNNFLSLSLVARAPANLTSFPPAVAPRPRFRDASSSRSSSDHNSSDSDTPVRDARPAPESRFTSRLQPILRQ